MPPFSRPEGPVPEVAEGRRVRIRLAASRTMSAVRFVCRGEVPSPVLRGTGSIIMVSMMETMPWIWSGIITNRSNLSLK